MRAPTLAEHPWGADQQGQSRGPLSTREENGEGPGQSCCPRHLSADAILGATSGKESTDGEEGTTLEKEGVLGMPKGKSLGGKLGQKQEGMNFLRIHFVESCTLRKI